MYNIAICVTTYKRPKMLNDLLESLANLKYAKNLNVETWIIIVDNDLNSSAYTTVQNYSNSFKNLVYHIEPIRGISHGRNRAVAIAKRLDCKYVAFIDDDETAVPVWLDELFFAIEEYGADIVIGPVIPHFSENTPEWVIKGKFFNQKKIYPSGKQVFMGQTGNALFKREWLDKLDGPFDERLSLSGGEDTHLFKRLINMGAKVVWNNEAIVKETIPISRAKVRWILMRAYRCGNSHSLCDKYIGKTKFMLLIRLAKGIVRILLGLILLLPSIVIGKAYIVRVLYFISFGTGMIAGILGHKFEEYKTVHGA